MFEHSLESALIFGTVVLVTGASATLALPLLSAVAAATYYWYAVPVVLKALHLLTPATVLGGRVVLGAFLIWWLQRALRLSVGGERTARRELPLAVAE